jgi:hypothetical protein
MPHGLDKGQTAKNRFIYTLCKRSCDVMHSLIAFRRYLRMNKLDELLNRKQSLERQIENSRNTDYEADEELEMIDEEIHKKKMMEDNTNELFKMQ